MQPAQQPLLRALVEPQNPLAPQLPQGVHAQPQIAQPGRIDPPAHAEGAFGAADGMRAADHPLRRDRRGRIDAHPAAAVEPHLVPGMRVALAQDPVIGVAVVGAALVAGDHARRNAGGAHQGGERRGVVPAEAAAGVEQEFVDRILAEHRRLERVEERLCAKHREHRLRVAGVVRMRGAQFAGERRGARIAPRRQAGIAAARLGAQVAGRAHPRIGRRGEIDGPIEHRGAHQHVIAGEVGARQVPGRRPVERVDPVAPAGFQAQAVAIGRPVRLRRPGRAGRAHARRAASPGAAVEVMQHRAAPVALGRRRRRSLEAHAEGHVVGQGEVGDVARTQGVAEPRCGGVRILRHGPQGAGDPWKEQPHQQGERQRLRQRGRGPAQRRAERRGGAGAGADVGSGVGQAQLHRDGEPANPGQVREQPERFALEQGGERQEVDDEGEDVQVAAGVGLQQLQAGHERQQRRARAESVEGAKPQEQQADAEHRDGHAQAPGDPPAAPPGDRQARGRGARHQQRHPHRQRGRPRQQGERDTGGHPEQLIEGHRCRRGSHDGRSSRWPASARRQARRCIGPRPGAISRPGRRRP